MQARLLRAFGSRKLRAFNPVEHGLRPDFLLTNFTKLKGWGCKVGHSDLLKLLEGFENSIILDSPDCSFDRISPDLALVSTTDFFYPLVDDPYEQGRIGAANVLSDLFAAGVTEIRNSLMILGVSRQMDKKEQDVVTKMLIEGYADAVKEAGALVTGGQTVFNEWPMIGGTAIGLVRGEDSYTPTGAKPGDVLVLTKPLGSQIVVNVNQYLKNRDEKWRTLSQDRGLVTEEHMLEVYLRGMANMGRLNKNAAEVMMRHGVTSSTDVTGFGILGHAENLATIQKEKIDYVIDTLPVYQGMHKLDNIVRNFDLIKGRTPETSGGLLVSLPQDKVSAFVSELADLGEAAWPIGRVVEGTGSARISDSVEFQEVL